MNWDERYAAPGYLFGTQPNDFLVSVAERIPAASRVLCLADGEGRNGVYLASLGHRVTSIDASATGLEKAGRLATERGVELQLELADLAERDLGQACWDAIVSIFFHIPPAVRAQLYPRIVAALAPGGLLILESYRPEQLQFGTGGPPRADYMLTAADLQRDFAALEHLHLAAPERAVIEGSGHTGQAAVVQLLARKPRTA